MNHYGIVAKINKVTEIPGADKIQVAYVLGEQVVVSKDWGVGKVGILFPADLQLSEEYCSFNNLFRKSELNQDPSKTGFFDTNRKVRCQPFMKVRSEAFFTELSSLEFAGFNIHEKLKVGDKLWELNGREICRKFISPKTQKALENKKKLTKSKKVLQAPLFKEHSSTAQFKHNLSLIPKGALITLHNKVHGTSARYAYSKVVKTPTTFMEKVKAKLGVFQAETWEYLVGTRRVVLFPDKDQNKQGFHGSEAYRFEILEQLKPYLTKGMTVYGEIAGYANGKPIMGTHSTDGLKDKKFKKKYGPTMTYAYGCKEHEYRFHIYRISYTTEDGQELDFTDMQIQDWCSQRGLNGPQLLCEPFIYDGNSEVLAELVEAYTEREGLLTEDYLDPSHITEGVIVRVDHGTETPKFYKSKSYAFKVLESIIQEDFDYEDSC